MSTRSRIGIEGKDGAVLSVYCHSDGDPEGVGAALLAHHNSAEAARALVELGDLSFCEGAGVCPPGQREGGGVCSYRLWRGEEDTDAIVSTDREGYLEAADESDGEWAYLYGPRGWEVVKVTTGSEFCPLTAEFIAANPY